MGLGPLNILVLFGLSVRPENSEIDTEKVSDYTIIGTWSNFWPDKS